MFLMVALMGLVSLFFIVLIYKLNPESSNVLGHSGVECGLNCMSSTSPFSMQYLYLLTLFLVFDTELLILLVVVMGLGGPAADSYFAIWALSGTLTLVLFLEWQSGTLEWA